MKNILNRGFSEEPLNDFIALVLLIISKLTGNADFPITDPTLAALTAQLGVLQNALLIADPVAREQAILAARQELEQMLDDLADNLEKTSGMDPVKLSTTGFPLRKVTTQTGQPPQVPQNPELRRTDVNGQVRLVVDPSDRARGYEVETAADPDGPFTPYKTFSSTRNMMVTGFERGKDLYVRVRAIGPNNTESGWSIVVSILMD